MRFLIALFALTASAFADDFSDQERIIMIDPANLESVYTSLLAEYGKPVNDGGEEIVTIAAHWDDAAKTRKRAASLVSGTITAIPLSNGKLAFRALWEKQLQTDFEEGEIENVEEITLEQMLALVPTEEPEPTPEP